MKAKLLSHIAVKVIAMSLLFQSLYAGSVESITDLSECVVVSLDKTAWIVREDKAVKSTLLEGDILRIGDVVGLYEGNSVKIAFDKDALDIVHIEGKAIFKIENLNPTVIELNKGTVYTFLDKEESYKEFAIKTPSTISEAWGTRYKIDAVGAASRVTAYEGRVKVIGRDELGRETIDFVLLYDKEKTFIEKPGRAPESATQISVIDENEAAKYLEEVNQARQKFIAVDLNQIVRRPSQQIPAKTEISVPNIQQSETKNEDKIIF